jgi:hypothetical protein
LGSVDHTTEANAIAGTSQIANDEQNVRSTVRQWKAMRSMK